MRSPLWKPSPLAAFPATLKIMLPPEPSAGAIQLIVNVKLLATAGTTPLWVITGLDGAGNCRVLTVVFELTAISVPAGFALEKRAANSKPHTRRPPPVSVIVI